ncbi:hypothetical protein IJ670_00455 [bacterium]|nr:hypothetical protein [bacterium]
MEINNINNINFNRVIKLKTSGTFYKDKLPQTAKTELVNVLNNNGSRIYSDNEQANIRSFFINALGKDEVRRGISIKEDIKGNSYFLSGIDTIRYNYCVRKMLSKTSELENNKNLSKSTKTRLINQALLAPSRYLENRAENGTKRKPDTYIHLKLDKNDGRIKKVQNASYVSYTMEPTSIADGIAFRDKKSLRQYKSNSDTEYREFNTNDISCRVIDFKI